MGFKNGSGYSASVRLPQLVDGKSVRLAQIAERVLVLKDRCEAPPETRGVVVTNVDDDECLYPVRLPHGILDCSDIVDYLDLDDCSIVNGSGGICTRMGVAR
jgi:hypothetical protein